MDTWIHQQEMSENMAVLLKNGGLFLHVPKTGGSWVKHVLRDQGVVKMEWPHPHPDMERVLNYPRHYPRHYISKSLEYRTISLYNEINESYKFCFVRNPYSWYSSYWRYWAGLDWEFPGGDESVSTMRRSWKPNSTLHSYRKDDFRSFMRTVLENYPGYLTQMYGWYAPPEEINFVGRIESLVDDLLEALNQMDIDVDEEKIRSTRKVNTSPGRIDRPTWDDELWAAVRRLEAPVFERFGYE